MATASGVVVAFAGRRIDAPGAPPRFPMDAVEVVRARIASTLIDLGASTIISSAAAGADLLALDIAREIGLHRVVVLPFAAPRFRDESVSDRPGGWGPSFDRVLAELFPADVIVLDLEFDVPVDAFAMVNEKILNLAMAAAAEASAPPVAVVVWEGVARPGLDFTAMFRAGAVSRGLQIVDVSTAVAAQQRN